MKRNEISSGRESRVAESGDRKVERNKSRSSSRPLGHFVDETCRNHDTSSPFTNCKGAANMRGWNFAKQPHERSFCESVRGGPPPPPPPVRRKKPSAEEFKKETCRSEQQPRCVTKNTARTGFERSSRERLERNTTPLLEQEALLFAVWTSTVRFTDLIFYKFQESKHPGEETTQFLCATTREYLLFPILLVAEVVGYICNC